MGVLPDIKYDQASQIVANSELVAMRQVCAVQ